VKLNELNKLADHCLEAMQRGDESQHPKLLSACIPVFLYYRKKNGFSFIPLEEVKQDLANEAISRAFINHKIKGECFSYYLTEQYLIPLYQKLIDAHNKINKTKRCLCQSIFMNKGEGIHHNQYAEIKTPIARPNLLFAPHIYQEKTEWIDPTLKRFEKESALLEAPIFIGEWGFPTFDTTDTTITGPLGQLRYKEIYIQTAEAFDRMGVGSIKAWFLGSRTKQHFLQGGPSTWAIFSDHRSVGTAERKYITDIIARPYPQIIAGDIQSFMFNHATRCLDMVLKTDNGKGASKLFIGADRHYPDGFSVKCHEHLILYHNPLKTTGLEVLQSDKLSNPADFIWDPSRQQLIILKWPLDRTIMHLSILPGRYNDQDLF